MRILHLGVLALVVAIISGCAAHGPRKLDSAELAHLQGRSDLTIVLYPRPPFKEYTGNEGRWALALGPIGYGISESGATSRGEEIRAKYGLSDTLVRVKDLFVSGIAPKLGVQTPFPVQDSVRSDDLGELRNALGPRLIIDFRLFHWGIGAKTELIPFKEKRYRAGLIIRARLIRLETRTILWEAYCPSFRNRQADLHEASLPDQAGWTSEELTSNDSALLKAWYDKAAQVCAEQLLGQFLGR